MNAESFFDFAEGELRRLFERDGRLPDTALTWDGESREIREVNVYDPHGESGPDALKAVLDVLAHVAYAVGYEARLKGSEASSEALADGRHAVDEVNGVVDDDEALPEHVLFVFMAAEDGSRRVRAFEVTGTDRKVLGDRVPALEDAESPFSNLFEEERDVLSP